MAERITETDPRRKEAVRLLAEHYVERFETPLVMFEVYDIDELKAEISIAIVAATK